jgi:hypothetical protein
VPPDILWFYASLSALTSPLAALPMTDDDAGPTTSLNGARQAVPGPRGAGLRRFALWTFIGMGIGVLVSLVVLRVVHRDPTPTLTPEIFRQARAQWREAEPASYDIEIRVTGAQPAVYRVEVRDGEPQAAWRNGNPLLARRTFGTWSVPGMFGTMSRDVEAVERHEQGKADPHAPRLTLRAEFDSEYGYPARYRRIQWGSSVEVAWEVTEFRVIP